MKKVKLAIVIIVSAVFFASCANDDSSENKISQNFSGCTIKNWSAYKSFGAGFINSKITRSARDADESSAIEVAKLVGLTEDGVFETVTFVDETGNPVTQQMYLAGFKAFSKYTFLAFSDTNPSEIGAFNNIGPSILEYVLYTPTGKIYSLEDFEFINLFTMNCFDESDDAFFFYGKLKTDTRYDYIYKISVENDVLKIEQKIDTSKVNGWFCMFTDRYGNIYSAGNNIGREPNYILKTGGTLEKLSGTYHKAINNIVYSDDNWIDAAGNLVSADFLPSDSFYTGCATEPGSTPYTFLILQKENDYYYYLSATDAISSSDVNSIIYKIHFTDDNRISYTYSEIQLEDFVAHNFVVANERLYFLKDDEIFYIEIENDTGAKHTLASDYFFKTITTDNIENIYFTGVDAKLNDVSGVIDVDNNISINLTERKFNVVYLQPLN